MHAAIVAIARVIVRAGHFVGVAERGRIGHAANRADARNIFAHQPTRFGRVRPAAVGQINKLAPQIRKGFINRARLIIIKQVRRVFGDTVCQFMRHHIIGLRKTVTVHHLDAIPKRVLITRTEMHGGFQQHARVVNAVARVFIEIKIVRVARVLMRVFGIRVAIRARRITLVANQSAGNRVCAACRIRCAIARAVHLIKGQGNTAARGIYQNKFANIAQFILRDLGAPDQLRFTFGGTHQYRIVNLQLRLRGAQLLWIELVFFRSGIDGILARGLGINARRGIDLDIGQRVIADRGNVVALVNHHNHFAAEHRNARVHLLKTRRSVTARRFVCLRLELCGRI